MLVWATFTFSLHILTANALSSSLDFQFAGGSLQDLIPFEAYQPQKIRSKFPVLDQQYTLQILRGSQRTTKSSTKQLRSCRQAINEIGEEFREIHTYRQKSFPRIWLKKCDWRRNGTLNCNDFRKKWVCIAKCGVVMSFEVLKIFTYCHINCDPFIF